MLGMIASVFRHCKTLVPHISPKLLDAMTKLASIAGENNSEVVKSFVMQNHQMFAVKNLVSMAEILKTTFSSAQVTEVNNLLVNVLHRDETETGMARLDEYCGDWS